MSDQSPSLETPRLAPHPSVTEIVALATAYGVAASAAPAANRAALQRAIDAVNFLGFGRVYIPAGTYRFDVPTNSRAFTVYPNVIIEGAGRGLTTLKIADGQGDYNYVFSPSSLAVDCSNFQLRDLTLDQNHSHAVGIATIGGTNNRMALNCGVGRRMVATRCRFTDIDSINTVVFNSSQTFDVEITDNIFDAVGDTTDHDHSTIYTNSDGAIIERNVFIARASGVASISARTAIETHGGRHRVYGNDITNFRKGMNVTGISSHVCDGIIVAHNSMRGVQVGIMFWPNFGVATTRPKNIDIVTNTIDIDYGAWSTVADPVTTNGISLDPGRSAGTVNMRIAGNTVTLSNATGAVGNNDDEAGGIEWRSTNGALVDDNLTIENNIVQGSLGANIRVAATINRLRITGNNCSNPGQSSGAFANDFRTGILYAGVLTDMVIADNTVIDDQGSPTMQYGIYNVATTITNGRVVDNDVRGAIIKNYHVNAGAGKAVLLRATLPTFVAPSLNWIAGSTVLALDTGSVHTQTDASTGGAGATWTGFKQLAGSIVWDAGNIANGAGETSADIVVTGAALGDIVTCSANINLAGMTLTGYVSVANTVKLRLHNGTGGAVDLGNATYRVRVFKQ